MVMKPDTPTPYVSRETNEKDPWYSKESIQLNSIGIPMTVMSLQLVCDVVSTQHSVGIRDNDDQLFEIRRT